MKISKVQNFKGEFFKILDETPLSQIAVMTIAPGNNSGPEEIHTGDQIVYVISGVAEVEIQKEKGVLNPGDIVTIPKGAQHHVWNKGNEDLFLFTVYTPPQY